MSKNEVHNRTFNQGCQEGDVGGLPAAGGQREADPVQLVPEELAAVLGLGPGKRHDMCVTLALNQGGTE